MIDESRSSSAAASSAPAVSRGGSLGGESNGRGPCTSTSRVTTGRPKKTLMPSTSSGARCCSSGAAVEAARNFKTPSGPSADGQATAASYLHVSDDPGVTYYQRFFISPYVGNAMGIGNLAVGPSVSLEFGGAPQGSIRLLAMVSTASIPLPDEIAYRRDWRSYRIFLSFGDLAGEVERQVLPAPEPPPGG